MSHKKKTAIAFAVVTITALAIFRFASSRDPMFNGKSMSFWCDHLPMTRNIPIAIGGGYVRGSRTSTNLLEQANLREMEAQALQAIDRLGTNCLPTLLGRLRKKQPFLQMEFRTLLAKLGFIKRTEIGTWHTRREMALTGIVALGDKAEVATPELNALKNHPDPWVRGAAAKALKEMEPFQVIFQK